MSMYGLLKISNACNTSEARREWEAYYQAAIMRNMTEQANALKPPADSGWRTIDKRIAKLRALIVEHDKRPMKESEK